MLSYALTILLSASLVSSLPLSKQSIQSNPLFTHLLSGSRIDVQAGWLSGYPVSMPSPLPSQGECFAKDYIVSVGETNHFDKVVKVETKISF